MMRVVLDANVLVSGFPAERGVLSEILMAWSTMAFELVISEHILMKSVSSWNKPYYRRRYSQGEIHETLMVLRAQATMVVPVDDVHRVAPNEEDDLVLATAVAGQADYLVTGDIRFRNRVKKYRGIVILSPREFLTLLTEQGGPP